MVASLGTSIGCVEEEGFGEQLRSPLPDEMLWSRDGSISSALLATYVKT
jgi:hypothetical protein